MNAKKYVHPKLESSNKQTQIESFEENSQEIMIKKQVKQKQNHYINYQIPNF